MLKKENYLFQKINDPELTEITIDFKSEHIIQALNILIVYVHESITTKDFFFS